MKVLVIKDPDGELKPGAGIWPVLSPALAQAVKDEWTNNLSKKNPFQGCALVEAELTE